MLINLRNALMTGKRLPYDAEVEYLESTGTQWIDTGVIPDTVDLDINIALTVIAQGHLFGSRTDSSFSLTTNHLWSSYGNNAGQFRKDWIAENAYLPLSTTAPNIIGLHSSASGSSIVNDGATWTGGVKTTNSLSLYLFAVNNNGTVATGMLKIYQCKITKNGNLVRDFIPVRKGTVGYLYDRVSGKLFGNAGTGDFALGPDVVPVEWLCSSANDIASATAVPAVWIDTGIALSTDIKMSLVASFASLPDDRLIGVYGGPSGRFDIGVSGNGTFLTSIGATTPNTTSDTYVHKFVLDAPNHMGYVDENGVSTGSDFRVTIQGNIMLFSRGRGDRQPPVDYYSRASKTVVAIYSAEIWKANALVRSFFPVRVGTDATSWEGAMMDVLTRRIYRNAGTGAFTYGNDLKYPIPAE